MSSVSHLFRLYIISQRGHMYSQQEKNFPLPTELELQQKRLKIFLFCFVLFFCLKQGLPTYLWMFWNSLHKQSWPGLTEIHLLLVQRSVPPHLVEVRYQGRSHIETTHPWDRLQKRLWKFLKYLRYLRGLARASYRQVFGPVMSEGLIGLQVSMN